MDVLAIDAGGGLALGDVLARLGLALLFGGLIGLDRDLRGKRAGLRTLVLVALATSGVTISTLVAVEPNPENLGRVVQGALTGIGFLGAGVILRRPGEDEVSGLTTAAAVWFTAAVAIVCGLGEYVLAWSMFALGFGILLVGRGIERFAERLVGRVGPARRDHRSSHGHGAAARRASVARAEEVGDAHEVRDPFEPHEIPPGGGRPRRRRGR